MTLLAIALKPFVIAAWIVAYRLSIYAMYKYLPNSVSDFLLKQR